MYAFNPNKCLFDACRSMASLAWHFFVRHLMQIALSRNVANVVNVRCLTSIKHFNQRLSRQNKLFTLLVRSAVVLIIMSQVGDPTWAWHHPEVAEKTM